MNYFKCKEVFFLSKFLLLIIFICIYSGIASSCEVSVFDCGQGNTVAARFKKQSMVFDAGYTSYARFAGHDDDTASESEAFILFKVFVDKTVGTSNNIIKMNKKESIEEAEDSEVISSKNYLKKRFKNFVNGSANNIALKAVFLSHPDKDHYNLVKNFELSPEYFVLGGKYSLYTIDNFQTYLQPSKINHKIIYATKSSQRVTYFTKQLNTHQVAFTGGNSPLIEVLSVNAGNLSNKNKDSMIIKISYNHNSMIIPGDAEAETWEYAKKSGSLSTDVLLISHHGSDTHDSTTDTLLAAIKPKIALITAGFQHHHPRFNTIKLL